MNAVRAARVMSALEDAGWRPRSVAIVGEADKPAPRARAARRPRRAPGATARARSRAASDDGARPSRRGAALRRAGRVRRWLCGAAAPARAYDFTVDVRTIGQGYQVRRLRARRQQRAAVAAAAHAVPRPERVRHRARALARRRRRPQRPLLRRLAALRQRLRRLHAGRGRRAATRSASCKQNQIDILYAFLGGRNVGGHVDFQLGRQIHFDLVDFYAFDGADVARARDARRSASRRSPGPRCAASCRSSSPIYELDGTSAGSRDPATRPAQNADAAPAGRRGAGGGRRRAARWSARLAYRRIWSATADQLPGEPASGVNDEKLSLTASAAWRDRVFLAGGVRYNLLLGELRRPAARAAGARCRRGSG